MVRLTDRIHDPNRVKKNTYEVVWEHVDGHISTSVGIDTTINGDGTTEAICVLAKFAGIFRAPSPVKRIIELKLVRENW